MYVKGNKAEKVPAGKTAGETAVYAVSLILFMICGVLIPNRNFKLIEARIGQGGELPSGTKIAMEVTGVLNSWQGLLIVVFVLLVAYFWWTSTWQDSTSRKVSRFLLWCVPVGLYIVMMWVLYWLQYPLSMASDYLP